MNYLIIIFLRLLSYFPLFLLEIIANLLYIINKIIFRYRYTVVFDNLKIAYPKKSELEIKKIRRLYYKYFFKLIFEIIKSFNVNHSFIDRKVKITNPELLSDFINKKKNVILLSGHYNNWEWLGAKISIHYNKRFIAVYKKLNSPVFNRFFINYRSRFGGQTINMEDSIRYFINNKNKSQLIGMIADQNPVVTEKTDWISFFGKDIPVFMGAEKIAKKLNYPVIFCNMQYDKNNYYTITFDLITENPQKNNEGEITKCYFSRLEEQIRNEPYRWLWSHRRWRHTRQK